MLAPISPRRILIAAGADLGGAFELHREPEIYPEVGVAPFTEFPAVRGAEQAAP